MGRSPAGPGGTGPEPATSFTWRFYGEVPAGTWRVPQDTQDDGGTVLLRRGPDGDLAAESAGANAQMMGALLPRAPRRALAVGGCGAMTARYGCFYGEV